MREKAEQEGRRTSRRLNTRTRRLSSRVSGSLLRELDKFVKNTKYYLTLSL
jgi:hypothetical protein